MSTLLLIQKPPYHVLVSPRGLAVLVQHAFPNVTSVIRVARHGNQRPLSLFIPVVLRDLAYLCRREGLHPLKAWVVISVFDPV